MTAGSGSRAGTGPARGAAQADATRWPAVSVVMPVRDEADGLASAVGAVLGQDYPGPLELVLAVAPSADGTDRLAERLARTDARVRVVDNPAGTTPAGLNAAIRASAGAVVARCDGHAVLPPGYLRRAVALLDETGADNVGGVQRAVGSSTLGRAVAAAMTSRFGVGDARFHYGGRPGPADTVYLGVFRRSALERAGGYDETLLRSQDAELNWRIREGGGVVWFDPGLVVAYRPRDSLPALARQYFSYGRYKRLVARRYPRSLRWRQLVPPAALLANAAGVVTVAGGRRLGRAAWLGAVAPGAYLVALLAASVVAGRGLPPGSAVRLPAVFATMHHAWALGFLTSPPGLAARRSVRRAGVAAAEGAGAPRSAPGAALP